jgi:hypothetical protein
VALRHGLLPLARDSRWGFGSFEIASAADAGDRVVRPSTPRADELRGFFFGFPREISAAESMEMPTIAAATPALDTQKRHSVFRAPGIRPDLKGKFLGTGPPLICFMKSDARTTNDDDSLFS